MKRIKVNAYEVVLVIINNKLTKILSEGVHWLWRGDALHFSTTQRFMPYADWAILKNEVELMQMLDIVEVNDNEIVIEYKDGKYNQLLKTGTFAYWKGVLNLKHESYNVNELEVPKNLVDNLGDKINHLVRKWEVASYEKALLYVNGEFVRVLAGGIYHFWKNENKIEVIATDLRQQKMEISGQELLTKDKAQLRLNFDLTYRVVDVEKALVKNKQYAHQLYTLMQLNLREFIGELTLDELLANKHSVAEKVTENAKNKAKALGVEILNTGIRDVILPGEVREIMNQVLVAQKKAEANTITRREETASTRSLLNTAKLMEDNEMLLRLKEMEYVEKIADKIGEITVSGNGNMVKQLKEIFGAKN